MVADIAHARRLLAGGDVCVVSVTQMIAELADQPDTLIVLDDDQQQTVAIADLAKIGSRSWAAVTRTKIVLPVAEGYAIVERCDP